ncbi:MAG: cytochrome c-type biogenesis protein CcmH [Pseudomonadota bacterium]|nr:cytochrome c-type biogenesis protein CcmH [Pseudomonadota bacterium]
MLAAVPVVHAKEAPLVGEDPVLQQRMMKLASILRCLVCQNQTIADSHAELAEDLRKQILAMMKDGKSDQEIEDYMVARYGDFVLYRPPLKATTVLLWAAPALLVVLGGALVVRAARRRNELPVQDEALDPEQQRLADEILHSDQEGAV